MTYFTIYRQSRCPIYGTLCSNGLNLQTSRKFIYLRLPRLIISITLGLCLRRK